MTNAVVAISISIIFLRKSFELCEEKKTSISNNIRKFRIEGAE